MCNSSAGLEYSPRRPVALLSYADQAAHGDDTTIGGADGTLGGASVPPSGPSQDAFMRNLRVAMPLGRKVRLVMRNTATKVKKRQNCCGHPGEPGC